jgi:ferredoxin-NADP reductase/predicted pyridoxine 5'-phosphate oxidase superfamily flavin-nucleotide-binding protein
MAFSMAMPWNAGEETMHQLLHVPPQDNPTSSMLTPQASFMLQKGSMLALGTLDADSRPWTTLWGGSPGFSEPLGGGFIGTRTLVDATHDPVVQALVGDAVDGEMMQPKDGKMLAGLAIDLMTRKRVKIAGKMVAGTAKEVDVELDGENDKSDLPTKQTQIQLVTKIEQSLGNCPKYLNQYQLQPALVKAEQLAEGAALTAEAKALITHADMFFMTTSTSQDMDVNHRGGPPGFVRIISATEIAYPEYSGNRLYQSLGNLQLNPKIGITFPHYETGDVLYITGTTEILVGADANKLLRGSNLAVKIHINSNRYVSRGLPFRGVRYTPSPYNPRIRPLATEGNIKSSIPASTPLTVRLSKKTLLTPSIARFTFTVEEGISYLPGQWVALNFKEELDIGYEHMRDEDPLSLNDDFVRTFTISSTPDPNPRKHNKEFEITVRNVGPVTNFLFRQNERAGFEVPVLGVGGDFTISPAADGLTPFIAGGVGITPLLSQIPYLDLKPSRFQLFWTLKMEDSGLVADTFRRFPKLAKCTKVYFTNGGDDIDGNLWAELVMGHGARVFTRRLWREELGGVESDTWFLCAGKGFREEVVGWLEGTKVVCEGLEY